MKLDEVTVRAIAKVAKDHNISTERAFDIVKAYYEAVHHVGKTSTTGVLIHIKNLGKLVYSTRRQDQVKVLQENYQLLKGR